MRHGSEAPTLHRASLEKWRVDSKRPGWPKPVHQKVTEAALVEGAGARWSAESAAATVAARGASDRGMEPIELRPAPAPWLRSVGRTCRKVKGSVCRRPGERWRALTARPSRLWHVSCECEGSASPAIRPTLHLPRTVRATPLCRTVRRAGPLCLQSGVAPYSSSVGENPTKARRNG